jgi:hypothetical protein
MTAIIPVALQLLLGLIKWVIEKYANDKDLEKAFAQFAELARSENIKTIQARNRAEKNQLEAANKEWDKIEQEGKKK